MAEKSADPNAPRELPSSFVVLQLLLFDLISDGLAIIECLPAYSVYHFSDPSDAVILPRISTCPIDIDCHPN